MTTIWDYNALINIDIEKSLGNTYTHPFVAENIIKHFANKKFNNILEPCVGAGSFYNFLDFENADIYDIDPEPLKKINLISSTNVYNEDFLTKKINKEYDLIITNPPYISYNNIPAKNKENYLERIKSTIDFSKLKISDVDKKSDLYIYFFLKSLSLLSKDGTMVFLCSDKWLNTNYGKILRNIFSKNDFNIETIVVSNYHPFFRDETNAIITVIKRKSIDTFNLYQIYSEFTLKDPFIFNKNVFKGEFTLNKLIYYPEEFEKTEKFNDFNAHKNLTLMKNFCAINSSGKGFNELQRLNILEEKGVDKFPLFFQKQARVNNPAIYKSDFDTKDLKYYIDIENIRKYKLKVQKNIMYLTGVIDKFPLVFLPSDKTISCSKYYTVQNVSRLDIKILPILFHNIISLQNIETYSQNATKRSSRKGQNGSVKELRINVLENIKVPNFKLLSNQQIDNIIDCYNNYNNEQIFTLEQALENEHYIKMNKLICEYLNFNYQEILDNLLMLYYRRLRWLEKL